MHSMMEKGNEGNKLSPFFLFLTLFGWLHIHGAVELASTSKARLARVVVAARVLHEVLLDTGGA